MRARVRAVAVILAVTVSMAGAADTSVQEKNASPSRTPAAGVVTDFDTFYKTLPRLDHVVLDEALAVSLTAMPLSCLDRPHARPATRGYLWEATYRPVEDFQKTRIFYGCFDWHSAVNSAWSLVKALKLFPGMATAPLIRAKLDRHFGKSNVAGEVAFFKDSGQFEVPYGLAWTLKLQGELLSWNDPDAKRWAENLQPLATLFSQRLTAYFTQLERPVRTGLHPNSALGMHLLFDYLDIAKDEPLKRAVLDAAKRFYSTDTNCTTAAEPGPTDFISPCMTEAALMGRILTGPEFAAWFERFMPPLQSREFAPLTVSIDPSLITSPARLNAKSHMIGLAFMRAEEMNSVAASLPKGDPRAAALRRLSAVHARQGMSAMHVAGYVGSHFLGAFTFLYLLSVAP
jgi:hypothetical protein